MMSYVSCVCTHARTCMDTWDVQCIQVHMHVCPVCDVIQWNVDLGGNGIISVEVNEHLKVNKSKAESCIVKYACVCMCVHLINIHGYPSTHGYLSTMIPAWTQSK